VLSCVEWKSVAMFRLFGSRLVIPTLALFLATTSFTLGQSSQDLYQAGVTARATQGYQTAISKFRQLLQREPDNSDALVLLGFSQLAAGLDAEAQVSFDRVLVLAPDYHDARLGLARIAFGRNDLEGARALLDIVLDAQPDNQEAVALLQKVSAPVNSWRLDAGMEVSMLSGGRPSWTDSFYNLSYRFGQGTSLSGRLRQVTRPSGSDLQLEARADHVFSKQFSAYGLAAATPDADFVAQLSLGGGMRWQITEGAGLLGPLYLTLDARHDVFATSAVTAFNPGMAFNLFDGQAILNVRWLHSQSDIGTMADGYMLRLDATPVEGVGAMIGYSFAPEISGATTIETQTIFAGATFSVSDTLTLRVNYAHEFRAAFDRDIFSLGWSYAF